LDNGKECSKIAISPSAGGKCCRTFLNDIIVKPNPDINGNITVHCAFSSMSQGPIILSIVDLQGITRISIYEGLVTSLSSQFNANVNNLQTGQYYIKLESPSDNELIFTPFIKK